jgi:hypothetical protein
MSADFRCGRHVESNQTRGNFIGVNMAEYEIEPLKVLQLFMYPRKTHDTLKYHKEEVVL